MNENKKINRNKRKITKDMSKNIFFFLFS